MCIYLAGAGNYITGQTIIVDGGQGLSAGNFTFLS